VRNPARAFDSYALAKTSLQIAYLRTQVARSYAHVGSPQENFLASLTFLTDSMLTEVENDMERLRRADPHAGAPQDPSTPPPHAGGVGGFATTPDVSAAVAQPAHSLPGGSLMVPGAACLFGARPLSFAGI